MARGAVERVFAPILQEFSPEVQRIALISLAQKGIADFIGRNPGLTYTIQVNGATVASENAVGIGPATISYTIQRLPEVGRFAITTAVALSPPGPTGRYKNAWFLIADGIETERTRIPGNVQEIILINDEPYARKLNVRGAIRQGIPPGIVERVRQIVLRRYGSFVTANIEFHTLKGGYVLKRNTRRHRAGEEMTYPSLVIRSKI
jgi:hypothetical protein